MKNLMKIFRYEIVRNGKRRSYLITTFGLPLLAIALMYFVQLINSQAAASTGSENPVDVATQLMFDFQDIKKAGYVDESGLFTVPPTSDDLQPFSDEASAVAAMEAGEVDTVYVIQPDYLETGSIKQLVEEVTIDGVNVQPALKVIYNTLGEQLSLDTLRRIQDPVNLNVINLQREPTNTEAVNNEDTNFALVYGFAILFLITIMGTSGYLMQSVIEEKENRLIEILLSSVRPRDLLTGKVLALGVLGIFQIVVWIAIGLIVLYLQGLAGITTIITGVFIPLDVLPLLVIYFIGGYLLFAAAFGGVGAISSSISEGPQFSLIFMMPLLLSFYAFPAFITSPNGTLATVLSLFPLTSPMAMIMRAVVTPVPAWQIVVSIILLILGILAMFWVSARMFRVQSLLSGQVPKLRELPKLIFGS